MCSTTDYGWNRPDGIVVVKGTGGTLTLTSVQSYGSVFIGDSTRVFFRNFEVQERISIYDSDQDNFFQDGVIVGRGIGFEECRADSVDYPIKIWPGSTGRNTFQNIEILFSCDCKFSLKLFRQCACFKSSV